MDLKAAALTPIRAVPLVTARRRSSDAHGHDDVAVAAGFVAEGTELTCGLLVLELEADGTVGCGAEEIEQVLGVEADGDWLAVKFLFDGFLGFAILWAGRGDFQALFGEHELHGMRALVGKLRNAA